MDQSTIKTLIDPLDSRIKIHRIIDQERKLMDALGVASVPIKGKDPISVTSVVCLLGGGHIPQYEDHKYKAGHMILENWTMGDFYCSTHHWEQLGLDGYETRHKYSSLRGNDIERDSSA